MEHNSLEVSYGQIAVFLGTLAEPFNDWSDAHVRQGFSWRPGSVSFATLDQTGSIEIEVQSQRLARTATTAERIIQVPFEIDDSGKIELATVAAATTISLEPGRYRLTFEHGRTGEGSMWCRFSFELTSDVVVASVLKADCGLAPAEVLNMEARPAS